MKKITDNDRWIGSDEFRAHKSKRSVSIIMGWSTVVAVAVLLLIVVVRFI